MASQTYTNTPKVRFISDGAVITLDPLDSEAKAAMEAWFDSHGDHTTVAITEVAANRGGYGEDGPYYCLVLTTSA